MLSRLYRAGSWLAVLLVAIVSLVPGQFRPHTGLPGPAEHMLAYLLTGFLLASRQHTPAAWTMIVALLSLYAGMLELLQFLVPGRAPEFIDFGASSAGAFGGVLLYTGAFFLFRRLAGTKPAA